MAKNAMSQLCGIWAARNISMKTKTRLMFLDVLDVHVWSCEMDFKDGDRKH